MKTNDIKSGTPVKLRNGWYGVMRDNMRGNTRTVEVHGNYTETGSVYSSDITQAKVDGIWRAVEHTASQLKAAEQRRAMGF